MDYNSRSNMISHQTANNLSSSNLGNGTLPSSSGNGATSPMPSPAPPGAAPPPQYPHGGSRPRAMADVMRDRQEEEERYKRTRSLPVEIIRKVQISIDGDGDFVALFENSQKRYALCVVLKSHTRMGWKECQAVNDVMKIASRGTQIDNMSFERLVDQLKTKYGKVQDPNIQNGRLTAVVFPGQGTIRTEKRHTILHTGMSFDGDGDLVFSATTNEDRVYRVCLELTSSHDYNKMLDYDCKAFIDILTMLETGDRLSPDQFFACGHVLRTKYNFVTPSSSTSGHTRCMTVLASRVPNNKPFPSVFEEAIGRVRQQQDQRRDGHTRTDQATGPPYPPHPGQVPYGNPPHHAGHSPYVNNPASPMGGISTPHPNYQGHPPSDAPMCPYPEIRYTRAIKEGGQGQVYAGLRGADEPVAIKVFLDQEGATEAYKTELRNLLKMSLHPNVVEVLDFFEMPAPALVMRLIEGDDLMDYLRSNGPQTEENGRRLTVGIAEGLYHLHRHGIIHRDFKSANILRRHDDGSPIIIDLGLGSVVDRSSKLHGTGGGGGAGGAGIAGRTFSFDESVQMFQRTSTIRGSFPWMAPEMITSQEWSEKTDVYAFGVIMWEIFSGQTPFVKPGEDINPVHLLVRIASGERPPLNDLVVSDELKALMKMCWDGDPRKRPSMRRVMDLLHGNDPQVLFKKFDRNASKGLDFPEFVTFLHEYVPNKVEMDMMAPLFRAIDTDNSGEIGLEEFQKFWWEVERTSLHNVVENSRRKML